MRFRLGVLVLLAALATSPSRLCAQGPAGADTLSLAAIADSQRVLSALAQRLAADNNDAAAWFRAGMIAWALADRARTANPPRGLNPRLLDVQADTSLRLAAQLAPDSVSYQRMVGRFLMSSGVSLTRLAAVPYLKAAFDAAARHGDAAQRSETAVDYGRVFWRRYDAIAYRWMPTTAVKRIKSVQEEMDLVAGMGRIRELLIEGNQPVEMDYLDLEIAESHFRQAYDAMPSSTRAFHHYAMTLAERAKWPDLQRFARAHVAVFPHDAWGWLAFGLAAHRQRNDIDAAPAFERGLAQLSASERNRLDRLDRVLPGGDTSRRARGTPAERAAYQGLYWAMADPMWTRHGSETRNEFLSRVTFAELRWTVDEVGVRGADTDRGAVFIRYGPPEIQASFRPATYADSAGTVLIWTYGRQLPPKEQLAFVFVGNPTFATMMTPPNDDLLTYETSKAVPVLWTNVVRPEIDSIPTQVARFRGAGDSVDVYVAADFRPTPILDSRAIRESVHGELWLRTVNNATVVHDSATLVRDEIKSWRVRVPARTYLLRVQAMAEHASRAARATGVVDATNSATGVTAPGLVMSDVLFAASAEARRGTAVRWSDYDVTPIANSIGRDESLALVWENYGLGARAGSARYTVAVAVRRERSGIGRIAASVVGGLARAARVAQGADRATITYDRTAPHNNTIVDYVNVSLRGTPPGNYIVSVQVTDVTTGRAVVRSRPLIIRE